VSKAKKAPVGEPKTTYDEGWLALRYNVNRINGEEKRNNPYKRTNPLYKEWAKGYQDSADAFGETELPE
jgi:hypothetical protein